MPYPSITVDAQKIQKNTELVVEMCRRCGVSVMGIVKACCGEPEVIRAVSRGGVEWIGDSRVQNLARMRMIDLEKPLCLLRLPMLSETAEAVRVADMSLVSELATAKALSEAALSQGRIHKVTLMVDLGDLREGLPPQKILPAAKEFAALPGLELHGLGVNFACYGGVIPTTEKLRELVALAEEIRRETGLPLPVVSGGNSASLPLVPEGLPKGITQLRIGEGILLGRETVYREALPGAALDAFRLHCEIIELQEKPSVPDGLIGTDAFGNAPHFEDLGIRRRAIAAIGRHDIIVENLEPLDPGASILGASSDHLLLDVTEVRRPLGVGSIVHFEMRYGALISGMMSSYVTKVMGHGSPSRRAARGLKKELQTMENVKVILWGLGSMGGGMGRDLVFNKKGVEIVGAIEQNPAKVGKDLGDVLEVGRKLNVTVSSDPAAVLKTPADLVILTTDSFLKTVVPQLKQIVENKKNALTIAEQMAAPAATDPAAAAELDKLAKANGVTILGTGVNPGFVLDTLIVTLSGACQVVKKIWAARINDLSPFGPTVMKTQGVGSTVEEFKKGVADGSIVGHIGFQESICLVSRALGWKIDKIDETREPIITEVPRETPHVKVKAGDVAGCRHIARGYMGGQEVITMEHPQQIHPHLGQVKTGDYITIEGIPGMKWSDESEIPGGIGTMAAAVNMIPHVINSAPGLKSMMDMPVISALMGDIREKIVRA